MRIFRRIMLGGVIDIDALPDTQKIYYKATSKVAPKRNSLGVSVIANKWDATTCEGIIVCASDIIKIGEDAFYNCSNLTSVTIPDSVTSIEYRAFYNCTSLKSIIIPESVTEIEEHTFSVCTSLESVTIPDSITYIGSYAFSNCTSLTSVYCKPTTPPTGNFGMFNSNSSGRKIYVPAGSVEVYRNAEYWSNYTSAIVGYDFEKGEIDISNAEIRYTSSNGKIVTPTDANAFGANITSNTYTEGKGLITFDGDVTSIGNNAFRNCYNLTSVTIPDSVTIIEGSAFTLCDRLTKFSGKFATEDGRSLIMDNKIIAYANESGTTYNIPDSVTSIGDYAFYNCKSLTSVTIPDSVTAIGQQAFSYCDGLTEFNGKFAEDNGRILVVEGVLTAFAPAGITQYTIPDSVTTIGEDAFANCTSLTSVTIPDSVTTIGDRAFIFCESLTSVTIGNSVTTIGDRAFHSCYNLKSVTIPDSVTSIGDYAFYNCKSLTSVTIPDSVTAIGQQAFCGCSSLTSVYCKATTPPALGLYVFVTNGSGRNIYVPAESVDDYKSATNWSEYADAIVGYDFENDIPVE